MSKHYKLGIIGWPVAHSRSPLIHNFWLAALKRDGAYTHYPIAPDTDFATALKTLFTNPNNGGLWGANITIPYKEKTFAALDAIGAQLDTHARSLQAVNTIYYRDGQLCGSNTDGAGFMAALHEHIHHDPPLWHDAPVLVLGAGGAARALIAALLAAGATSIRLCNRTRARAETLVATLAPAVSAIVPDARAHIKIYDWQARNAAVKDCVLLVNSTALGMVHHPPLQIELDALHREAWVSDIVYTPAGGQADDIATDLLKRAAAGGFKTIDGLGMLIHQAALSFALWFGEAPPLDAAAMQQLRALIVADLAT